MKISDFKNLISLLPYKHQSFDISKSIWQVEAQEKIIKRIFKGKDRITLNRHDLVQSSDNMREFIIKIAYSCVSDPPVLEV
jgi:hypothetical protein